MNFKDKYSLEFVQSIKSNVNHEFSVNRFIENNKDLLISVTSGMNDQNFPLEQDFEGDVDFIFFKSDRGIYPTNQFVSDAKDDGYILTGVKGIAFLVLKIKDSPFLPKDIAIFSPNKTFSPEDKNKSLALPYFISRTLGGIALHHSNDSTTMIAAENYVVLGRQ